METFETNGDAPISWRDFRDDENKIYYLYHDPEGKLPSVPGLSPIRAESMYPLGFFYRAGLAELPCSMLRL
jgi:hypothetical protein